MKNWSGPVRLTLPALCHPLAEPLNTHRQAGIVSTSNVTLIAADGSQVVPDRHAAVLFGLINVGAIIIPNGTEEAPLVLTDSNLSFDDDVVNSTDGLVPCSATWPNVKAADGVEGLSASGGHFDRWPIAAVGVKAKAMKCSVTKKPWLNT